MSLKDSIFKSMGTANQDTLTPQMATQMAISILDAFKMNMLNEAERTPSQNFFRYETYLITNDSRLWSRSVQANKKSNIAHLNVTDYAVSLRQALIALAKKDGIAIGSYTAIPSSGSDDSYGYGGGIWGSPRFILEPKSNRKGRCYALPLTREITYETFLKAKNDRITNSEGVFDASSHPSFLLGLPISFYVAR